MPARTDVDLDRYQELDLTEEFQPLPNNPTMFAILYANVMNNPENFPALASGSQRVLNLYDDLDDCLQGLGESLIARSLQMNPSEAYDRAVGMWQPGMPTNIPSDIQQNVASEAVDMIEMGRMVLAIRALLPELMRGQSATYLNSELYDRCLGYAQVRQATFVEIRGQYEDIHRMQQQAAALLGSTMTVEPPAELKVFQPDVIHQLMFNFYFSQAYLYATVTCR